MSQCSAVKIFELSSKQIVMKIHKGGTLCALKKWYFVTKIVLGKLWKFEAEGREFAKFLRSLEQFLQTVKGQNNFQ